MRPERVRTIWWSAQYLRDRRLLARDLLTPSGSIFVQISDENLHHVREVMDEVFGAENLSGVVSFKKTSVSTSGVIPAVADYLLWYAKDIHQVKVHQLWLNKEFGGEGGEQYTFLELSDRTRRRMTQEEREGRTPLDSSAKIFRGDNLLSRSSNSACSIR